MGMLGPMRVAASSSNVMAAHIIILFIVDIGSVDLFRVHHIAVSVFS